MTTVKRNEKQSVANTTTNKNNITQSQQSPLPKMSKTMGMIMATRPWSLTISITSILLGSTLAYKETNEFDNVILAITLIGAVSLQCFGNVLNSYYDFKNGNDVHDKSADRTMFDFGLSEKEIIGLIWYLLVQCLVCLILLLIRMDDLNVVLDYLLPLATVGFLLIVFYTANPIGLKYIGLGDLTIFLCFGPILVQSAFVVQTHYHDLLGYYYSIPLALTIVAVLHVNNTRDIKADTNAGSKTIASLLGFKYCYYLYIALYLIAYLYLYKLSRDVSCPQLNFPVILLPKLYQLIKQFKENKLEQQLDEKTGQFSFFFGGLYVIGVLLINK